MADDDLDLTGEALSRVRVHREPVPHEEQTRRGLLIGSASALALLVVANLGCAILLDPVKYAAAGGVLSFAQSVAAAVLGGAVTYYFQRRS